MLDIAKLAGQMPGISQHLTKEANASRQRIELGRQLIKETQIRQTELVEIQSKWRDRSIFAAAIPMEAIDTKKNIPTPTTSHSVFATDGSQISPSHHEIAYCYLINVGRIMLHYGQSLHPFLDSLPEVYYKPEDLYVSKQWGIRTEEWMGYKRTVVEAQMLAEMACQWVLPPGAHFDVPNLAMVDGSLIYWFIDGLPLEAREQILNPILAAWEMLRETKIPLMGYISASRSIEAINFLRFQACPFETPNCVSHCGNLEDKAPCQKIEPLRDATLWQYFLEPGQRGALWRSSSRILDAYPEEQRVYFCYVNVGTEIARIEIPAWVAEDSLLLEQSLGLMLAQVHKGYGYPVALAEAHNQAVIRGGDRARFFAFLEQQMIRAGLQNVGVSYKETRKRGSIA
jgi:NurA domain